MLRRRPSGPAPRRRPRSPGRRAPAGPVPAPLAPRARRAGRDRRSRRPSARACPAPAGPATPAGSASAGAGASSASGTRGSGPDSTASSSAASATVRAIGPSTPKRVRHIGRRPAGYPAGRWPQPDDVAEARRVAQRPAEVAAVGEADHPGGQRRGRAAAAAARAAAKVERVAGGAEHGVDRVRARSEFRRVRLAQADRPGLGHPLTTSVVAVRDVVGEQAANRTWCAPPRCRPGLCARPAGRAAGPVAAPCASASSAAAALARARSKVRVTIGVDSAVELLNPLDMRGDDLARRHLAAPQHARPASGRRCRTGRSRLLLYTGLWHVSQIFSPPRRPGARRHALGPGQGSEAPAANGRLTRCSRRRPSSGKPRRPGRPKATVSHAERPRRAPRAAARLAVAGRDGRDGRAGLAGGRACSSPASSCIPSPRRWASTSGNSSQIC